MAVHVKILLILIGITGIHSITTVSEVSVKAGQSVSIPCLYNSKYRQHVKYLCKGRSWRSCSYEVKTNQQGSGRFLISDDRNQRIFTVTIKDLTPADTYYWCAVEVDGGADDGEDFHLSVTTGFPSLYVEHQWITGFNEGFISISCYYRNSGETEWCRVGGSCVKGSSGSIGGTRVTIDTSVPGVFTVTMNGLRMESSGWYWCVKGNLQMPVHLTVTEKPTTTTLEPVTVTPEAEKVPTTVQSEQQSVSVELKSLIISLSLLIFIVMVMSLIWFMLKRHKQSKAESSAVKVTPSTESEVEVVYSSVVTTKQKCTAGVEAHDEMVIYSTLA